MDISIVVPSFNDTRIIRTVKSILSQNYPRENYEIIIVDGGSPQESFGETLEYLNDECDIVLSEKDKGIFDGLNKGIELASGMLIFMIGSDDFLISNDVFERAYQKFKEDKYELIVFELFYVNNNNEIERYWSMPKNMHSIPSHFQLPHFSTFMSRNLIGDTRFKLESFISADYGFFKELISKKKKSIIINSPAVCMTSGGQSSKNLINIIKGNMQSLLNEDRMNLYKIFRFFFHKLLTKTKHYGSMKLNRKKRERFQNKINSYINTIS
ncbi:glycosyltransferase [Gammaproteobacteria bacterium]|nr:glycosyltransferase [Gammaproteobacteria bacterium]